MARHRLHMKFDDPLVSMELRAEARLKGWAVAAAIIARLQEVGFLDRINSMAVLDPAISDLTKSELEELARQLTGSLMDTPQCLLEHQAMRVQATVGGASLFVLVDIVDAEARERPGHPFAHQDGAQIRRVQS